MFFYCFTFTLQRCKESISNLTLLQIKSQICTSVRVGDSNCWLMDNKGLGLMVLLLSISQVSTASYRVLSGDELHEKVNLPAENDPTKDKVEKPVLTSRTNNPSNQSEQAPPGLVELAKNLTQEQAPPARTEKTPNPKQGNLTVLAPPVKEESKKSTNSSEKGNGVVIDNTTGNKTDTVTKKDENVGNVKGLCNVASEKCYNDYNWIACLRHSANDSTELFLIVENKGEDDISFDLKYTPSLLLDSRKLDLAKHDSSKVRILVKDSKHAADITVNAGKDDCTLHVIPATATTFEWQKSFQQFASYATQLTPIYGAYLLLFTSVVISLIIWACCKFVRGRRRSDSRATYQQLEMGGVQDFHSNSANADVVDTADGWENGWDDNWDDDDDDDDEEAALGRPVATNGLPSSRSNDNIDSKDGWEVDWDD